MTKGSNLSVDQQRGVLKTVMGIAGFIAIIIAIFIHGLSNPRIMTISEMKNNGTFVFDKPRVFKDFVLMDYNRDEFRPENLQGKWSLVFFGFIYCPDVCPTTLASLNRFYKKQQEGDFADDLQVILVTVDPARDTPEKMRDYVQYFNPEFLGVTGEFLDIHRFATQLNIPFSKVPGGGENYTVEHSGNIAIINPLGHYMGFVKAPLELSKLSMTYKSIRLMNSDW